MGEPRAVTFEEAGDAETWAKINEITGAGAPYREGSCIGITSVPDADRAKIDKLLGKSGKSTKEGK